jgi:hypothetical protein
MIARRVAAVVAAVVMILAAVAVRAAITDDDDSGAAVAPSGRTLRLTCVTELADVCRSIDRAEGDLVVTVEPAGTTADHISAARTAADLDLDGWLTLAPWPELVAQRRAQSADPFIGAASAPLARSPLAIAIEQGRRATLERTCKTIDWTCIGSQAGNPWTALGGRVEWQTLKPAHPEPVQSATGLLVLGQAAGGFLAGPDGDLRALSSTDLNTSDTFAGWFQQLERAVPANALAAGADPFEQWLGTNGAAASLVGGLEAELGPGLATSGAMSRRASVLYPAPVASADVVFAPVGGTTDLGKLVETSATREALAANGWRVAGEPAIDGVGDTTLPRTNGLPRGGFLLALQQYWKGVR